MEKVTAEVLTLPAQKFTNNNQPRKPVKGFVEFVNALLKATKTSFEDWNFIGQENTRAVADGYFSALYCKNGGFGVRLLLNTGAFEIDCKQIFCTHAEGLVWWFHNSYSQTEQGAVEVVNPELIWEPKPQPRKKSESAPCSEAFKSLQKLAQL